MADTRLPERREPDPGIVGEERPQGIFVADTGLGYEPTDAHVRPLLLTAVAIFLVIGLSALVLFWMYSLWSGREIEADKARLPIAEGVRQLPPEPRVQADPNADLIVWRDREKAIQEGYGWVDRNAGVAKIPIDRALHIVAEKGLPTGEQYQLRPGDRFVHGVLMGAEQAAAATGGAAQTEGATLPGGGRPEAPAAAGGGGTGPGTPAGAAAAGGAAGSGPQ
jgi:hypothetical protein